MLNKYYVFIGIFLIIYSCIPTRSSYGYVRFKPNRFTVKPNTNIKVYQLIDTNSVYELVKLEGSSYFKNSALETVDVESLQRIIKFYKNGRIGFFRDIDIDHLDTLNAEKAEMGYYNYSEEGLFTQNIHRSPQSGYFLGTDKLLEIKNDTLIFKSLKSPQSSGRILETFIKKKIPKNVTIVYPDW